MFNHIVSSLHHRIAVFSAVTLLAGAFTCPAASVSDTAGDVKSVVGNSGLKLGQAEMLRQFEAASEQEYTLAGGDEVEIQVPGQPDLQGHHVVGPDGMITLALVGPVKVAGLTREAAGQAIAKAWGQFYSTISVTVQVTKYGSNRIVVVGRVATPGPIYFDKPPTLLEALAKSGAYGTRPPDGATANAVAKTGSQAAMIGRCAVYRGSEQVLWIDMQEMFSTGSGIDLHLRRDDVVYVPDEQEDLVSVLGQVSHPGAVRLLPNTKLVDLLAMTGGLTEDAASDKIRVVRPSTGVIQEVALKDLLDPIHAKHTVEISLQRGDVIYVPKSGFGKFGYVLGKFAPAGSLMMFGAVAAGR